MFPSHTKTVLIVMFAFAASACATSGQDRASSRSDDYSTWMRVIGLYPVTRIPVALGYARWQDEYRGEIESWTGENARRWTPSGDAPEAVLKHAPVFFIEDLVAADRFGYPEPLSDDRVGVDTSRPVVSWRLGKVSFKGEVLDQISYILWFPERPKSGRFDLVGGSLDILIFRVTLSPEGAPVVYDTIHGCGCYHLFFPVPPTRRKPMPEDDDMREAAFVPFAAPLLKKGERLGVRVSSGAHYVVGLEAVSAPSGQPYQVADARDVTQGIAHLYDRNGILPQSRRLERFFLWPMGIKSAGAMRAWGSHATAFVGKRHFDDADLLDRAFE